ncbi:MAG: NAD(P)-binding domain-containing protein, partial [Pseudomonadota bacterium]
MKMYGKADVDTAALEGKKIAIIGYGSQGRAHASNLKDSGHNVVVGLREGSGSRAAAENDGHTVQTPVEAATDAALVALLTPDTTQAAVY